MWCKVALVGGGVCVYVGWVLLAVQVWKCAGGERCVDLETQKEGKEINSKSREAEVTSAVRERSHANNARVLCLECQLKTSLASQEHAYRVLMQTVSNRKHLVCL